MKLNEDPYRHGDYYLNNQIELTKFQRIAEENDLFRKYLLGNKVRLSNGVSTLDTDTIDAVIKKIRNFEFNTESHSGQGHNCDRRQGLIEHDGMTLEWTIYGYYDEFGIPDLYQMDRYILIKMQSEPNELRDF